MTLRISPATLTDWPDIDLLVYEAYLRDNPKQLLADEDSLKCKNDSQHVLRCIVRLPSGELAATWSLELLYTQEELFKYLGGHVTFDPIVFPILVGGRAAASISRETRGAFNTVLDISFKLLDELHTRLGRPVSALNVHYQGNPVVKKLVALGYEEHEVTRTKGIWGGAQVTTYATPEAVATLLQPRLTASNQVPPYEWAHPVSLADMVLIQNPVHDTTPPPGSTNNP
ncbi:MAG: hypothetical protein ABW190_11675 [Rhizobacter sp.]